MRSNRRKKTLSRPAWRRRRMRKIRQDWWGALKNRVNEYGSKND